MKIAGNEYSSATQLADWILQAAAAGVGELPPDTGPADALNRAWKRGDDAVRSLLVEAAVDAAQRGDGRVRSEVLVLLESKSSNGAGKALRDFAAASWIGDPNPARSGEPLGRALVTNLSKIAHQDAEAERLMHALAPQMGGESAVLNYHLMWDASGEGLTRLQAWGAAKRPISVGLAHNLGLAFTMAAPDSAVDAATAIAGYGDDVREAFLAEAKSNLADATQVDAVKTALGL